MSMHALLLTVRNTIRSTLGYADKDCDLAPPDGQPPPSCGDVYVAVHEGSSQMNVSYSDFDEVVNIDVTVTMKLRGVAFDRLTQQLLYGDEKSLDRRARAIAAAIHADTTGGAVTNAANALKELLPPAEGHSVQGFFEPLRCAGIEKAREVGPAWFHANLDNPNLVLSNFCGYTKTIRFVGARRIQETGFAN